MNPEDKALEIVQDAMKEVKQELIIIDGNGVHHLVYIHDIVYNKGLDVKFSSMSTVTDELTELVEKAIMAQLPKRKKTLWERFKLW